MKDQEEIKTLLASLREEIAEEKKKVLDIETLIGKKFERGVDLWEFSQAELEEEMWKRYLLLEKNADPFPEEWIAPPPKFFGWVVPLFTKIFRRIAGPSLRIVLAKQGRFNKETVGFEVAAFLTLQKMKERIEELESRLERLFEEKREEKKEKGIGG